MAQGADLVARCIAAFYGGDAVTARQLVADDLTFRGPNASYDRGDDYLKVIGHAAGVKRVDLQRIIADGADVSALYELEVEHAVGRITVAEWYRVEGGLIRSIRMVMDTGPFVKPAKATAGTAIDPVCGMTVDMASAPATHAHAGVTYWFCNPGCRDAFAAALTS